MYENLMEQALAPENWRSALEAVMRNDGAPGIDRMRAAELEKHLGIPRGEKSRQSCWPGPTFPQFL